MLPPRLLRFLLLLSVAVTSNRTGAAGAVAPSESEIAAQVDALFRKADGPAKTSAVVDDATFLRRVSLDLTGRLPTPEQMSRFAADKSPDRRQRLVESLLNSEAYAVNWGRYWRDVVTYHTPASGNYLRWQLFDRWWVEQLRRNRPWDEVVTALITASGINDEIAPVNYLTGLYGNPVEIAATTSRVFLGVQIQCAQCHDAKTEKWRRKEFHELAAYFGRARLIQHKDVAGRGTPYDIESRSDGQYTMTDKRDASHLIEMRPRFLTGEGLLPLESDDVERRQVLARLITSPENPWFAPCYVNRIWTAMLGWGFYPGVADLGGGSRPQYPEVLGLLEENWIASGHDVRWLFRTITRTEAYQQSRQGDSGGHPHNPAVCPSRLRPEQVFESLQQVLGFNENDKSIPAPGPRSAPAVQRHEGLRNMVYQAFKVDPSLPRAEVHGTIPQALLMMNSVLVYSGTSAKGKTLLAALLERGLDDGQIIDGLYERALARRATAREREACLRYVRGADSREEALEDVLWCLVNSTEFLHKK
jgi:hypothetical protein